jgi:hypothetical protein
MTTYFKLPYWKQPLPVFFLFTLILAIIALGAPSAFAQTTNPLQDWTVVNGNAGVGGTIGLNVFHFFMWALMGVITIFGIKSCIAAASSGQTQQLWPRIMATVLGLAIPFFVNWITSTGQ